MNDLLVPATFILGFMVAVTVWMIVTQKHIEVQDSQIEELLKKLEEIDQSKQTQQNTNEKTD